MAMETGQENRLRAVGTQDLASFQRAALLGCSGSFADLNFASVLPDLQKVSHPCHDIGRSRGRI